MLSNPDVTVEFNKTTYNDAELFNPEEFTGRDSSTVVDIASFHKADDIFKKNLKKLGTSVALIPPGLTSLL